MTWLPKRVRLTAWCLAGMLAASTIGADAAHALPLRLPPIDRCAGDPSLIRFRAAMADVARREDARALFAMSAPRSKPASSTDYLPPEDWTIIRAILKMGCIRSGSERVMPSAPTQLGHVPDAELKNKLIALPGAKLLEEPNDEKSAKGTLQWDVVTGVGFASDTGTIVQLADGREGWVSDESLYWLDPSVRYEIGLARRGGKWMIVDHWW